MVGLRQGYKGTCGCRMHRFVPRIENLGEKFADRFMEYFTCVSRAQVRVEKPRNTKS